MKNILVPTDFSNTAKCAFFYARKLAEQLGGARIKLVHVFMPAVESEYPNFVPPVSEFLKVRQEMLDEFVDETCRDEALDPDAGIVIDKELLVGFPADEISRVSGDYDLIVMGTTGDSDLLNKLFGSVSSAVCRRADCPVILIPREMDFTGFDHILYASNYESITEEALESILDFNRRFRACIHFVHVHNEEDKDYDKSKEEIFEELFAEGDPDFSFEIAEVDGKTVAEGLNTYAEKHDIDLVVMVNQHRGFWENIFHKSQTKRMALTSRIPLMVLQVG